MKKISLIILFASVNLFAQDFNLFNPSSEMYLFSAYDEGANAFRYNPAVLGLGHRLNAAVNYFQLTPISRYKELEFDFALNSGNFGIAYRNYVTNRVVYGLYHLNFFSVGFGIGSKKISLGLLVEKLFEEYNYEQSYFGRASEERIRFGLGVLFRPNNFISTAFTYRTKLTVSAETIINNMYQFGIGIRPLLNDRLTLMADFGFMKYKDEPIFKTHILKAGVNVKVANGLYLNVNYTRLRDFVVLTQDNFNFGVKVDLNNFSLRYNNSMFRKDGKGKARNFGNHFSLTWSLEKQKSVIPESKKILEVSLSGSLQDFNTEDILFGLLGTGKRSVHEVIADIDYAAKDKSVSGLLLRINPLSTGRFEINANVEELCNSIGRFRKNGKQVTAYIVEDCGIAEYFIATHADKIIMSQDALFFYGLSVDVLNYRQLLDKYGIELQNVYAGKYKLTFQGLLDSSTAEGKEVIDRMLDVIYEKMLKQVSSSRKINIDDYMESKLSQPMTGKEAFRLGLVDMNGWYADAKEIAQKDSQTENIVKNYNRNEWDNEWGEPDQIAIVGVYGSITTGESQPPPMIESPIKIPFSGGRTTGSQSVIRQLEEAFSNPRVKVVILRVDSGGGSALGSSEINDAVIRLKNKYKKPFLVSMGSYAASGGYEVSVNADKIFADDMTVTGSIGVFTSRPSIETLINEQKLKVESFKRGEHSDIGSFYKDLSKEEIEIIQGIIDFYYDRFITEVAKGRNMTKEEANEVAQGRVWLGSDAMNKKLVDKIGGLYETIAYAKRVGKVDDRYKILYYAVPGGNPMENIINGSVLSYLQNALFKSLGFDEEERGWEIKY